MIVKDMMVPLEEYAIVSVDASLYDALIALEQAQLSFGQQKYWHRAILVKDDNGHVVGKISQMDVIKALEPKYEKIGGHKVSLSRFGFSEAFIKNIYNQFDLWSVPISKLIKDATEFKVSSIMYDLNSCEYIDETKNIVQAIHMLVIGHHHSLLVKRGDEVVGILRLTDVFHEVYNCMKNIESGE